MVEWRPRPRVDAVQSHRAAQRREVGHGVGAGARRQTESAVEQSVPGGLVGERVHDEADGFVVIDLA